MRYPVELINGPAYLKLERPKTPWIIQSLIPKSGMTLVHAPAKAGKSTVLMQLCSALSDPKADDYFGLPIFEHGPVCYLQLDTPSDLWAVEYVQKADDAGMDFTQTYFHDRQTMPKGLYPFNIRQPDHALWLSEWVSAAQPLVVIVDTWRSSYRGEEDKSDTVQQAASTLQSACQPAALVLIHHEKKGNSQFPSDPIDTPRGSTALPGFVDVLWKVTKRNGWRIEGRGGECYIKTKFNPETRLVEPDFDASPALIAQIKADKSFESDRARARHLQTLTGLPLETCRNHIRGLTKTGQIPRG